MYEAWGRGDYEAAFEVIDREVEWFGPPDVSNRAEALEAVGLSE